MRRLLLLAMPLVLYACGANNSSLLLGERGSVNDDPLLTAAQFWQSQVVRYCDQYPAKENCDDGDAVLFNGLLCASGESVGCDTVRRSQSADGRWWRSPGRTPGNRGQGGSFSRDMALGTLLYLATTRDRDAAERWMRWMEGNRPCTVRNPVTGGCTIRGLHRYCTDDSNNTCTLTPLMWSLMADVWESLGIGLHPNMNQFRRAFDQYAADDARRSGLGFELHLKAVQVFLREKLGLRSSTQDTVAGILTDRQGDNPFFQYVRYGYSSDVEQNFLGKCPRPDQNVDFRRAQWAWERDTSESAWRETMGWDCLFLARLSQRI